MKDDLCLATPPGYDPLPPRCFLNRGHVGEHRAHKPMAGPAPTWPNTEENEAA